MKLKIESLNLDALSPPISRADQWLSEVAAGETAFGFEDWLVIKLTIASSVQPPESAEGATTTRTVKFHQGPVEFELIHGACYEVAHPQKGVRHFKCLLDGNFPLISFYRPGTSLRFP